MKDSLAERKRKNKQAFKKRQCLYVGLNCEKGTAEFFVWKHNVICFNNFTFNGKTRHCFHFLCFWRGDYPGLQH